MKSLASRPHRNFAPIFFRYDDCSARLWDGCDAVGRRWSRLTTARIEISSPKEWPAAPQAPRLRASQLWRLVPNQWRWRRAVLQAAAAAWRCDEDACWPRGLWWTCRSMPLTADPARFESVIGF